jgi:hypothetical protein
MKKAPRWGALVAAGDWLFCWWNELAPVVAGYASRGVAWRATHRRRLLDGESVGYAPRGAGACGSGRGAALTHPTDKHRQEIYSVCSRSSSQRLSIRLRRVVMARMRSS